MTLRTNARVAGFTYWIYFAAGIAGLLVARNAPVTAVLSLVTSLTQRYDKRTMTTLENTMTHATALTGQSGGLAATKNVDHAAEVKPPTRIQLRTSREGFPDLIMTSADAVTRSGPATMLR